MADAVQVALEAFAIGLALFGRYWVWSEIATHFLVYYAIASFAATVLFAICRRPKLAFAAALLFLWAAAVRQHTLFAAIGLSLILCLPLLVKRYRPDAPPAVDGLSFTVRPGIVTGFLGPNGAGKSSTMRILAGTMAGTSGRASIWGVSVALAPAEAKRHMRERGIEVRL